jgi:hypothetical protein
VLSFLIIRLHYGRHIIGLHVVIFNWCSKMRETKSDTVQGRDFFVRILLVRASAEIDIFLDLLELLISIIKW